MSDNDEGTVEAPPESAAVEPSEVADDFIAAAQEAGAESGISVTGTRRRKVRNVATVDGGDTGAGVLVAAPEWTEDGIGLVSYMAFDGLLIANDLEPLEEEEEKKVSKTMTAYANMRFKRAAVIQPEVMIVSMLASILAPRLAAKRLAREKAAAETVTPLHAELPEGRTSA